MIKTNHNAIRDEGEFIRLWAHECMRVFQDRLINEVDQDFFQETLANIINENFKREWKQLVKLEPLLFTHFVPTIYPGGDTSRRMMTDLYCELTDHENLKVKSYEMLEEYN